MLFPAFFSLALLLPISRLVHAAAGLDLQRRLANTTTCSESTQTEQTSAAYPYSSPSSNATCFGATVNVPNATLDWWNRVIYQYAPSSFTILPNATTWDLVTATTTFDINDFTEALGPGYAATTVVTQKAYIPINTTTGHVPTPDLFTKPPLASIVLPGPPLARSTAHAGTPIVYWSAYEVDNLRPYTAQDGRVACSTSKASHTLTTPFAMFYPGNDPSGLSKVTGPLPGDFLADVDPQITGAAGQWTALPTLVVIEQLGYETTTYINYGEGPPTPNYIVPTETSFTGSDVITGQLASPVSFFIEPYVLVAAAVTEEPALTFSTPTPAPAFTPTKQQTPLQTSPGVPIPVTTPSALSAVTETKASNLETPTPAASTTVQQPGAIGLTSHLSLSTGTTQAAAVPETPAFTFLAPAPATAPSPTSQQISTGPRKGGINTSSDDVLAASAVTEDAASAFDAPEAVPATVPAGQHQPVGPSAGPQTQPAGQAQQTQDIGGAILSLLGGAPNIPSTVPVPGSTAGRQFVTPSPAVPAPGENVASALLSLVDDDVTTTEVASFAAPTSPTQAPSPDAQTTGQDNSPIPEQTPSHSAQTSGQTLTPGKAPSTSGNMPSTDTASSVVVDAVTATVLSSVSPIASSNGAATASQAAASVTPSISSGSASSIITSIASSAPSSSSTPTSLLSNGVLRSSSTTASATTSSAASPPGAMQSSSSKTAEANTAKPSAAAAAMVDVRTHADIVGAVLLGALSFVSLL